MGFVRIMFLISALCLETRKECRPIKALLLCDFGIADDTFQRQSLMVEVIIQLYHKLPIGSDFKVVLYGKSSKDLATFLKTSYTYIHVEFRDLISTISIEDEMDNFFRVSNYRRNAELVYILTGNDKLDYKNDLEFKKKLTIVVFGNGEEEMGYFEWDSSSRDVFRKSDNAETAYQYIFDLTCQDSQLVCEGNRRYEDWSVHNCFYCSYVCSHAMAVSIYARCPYIKHAQAITAFPATDKAKKAYKESEIIMIMIIVGLLLITAAFIAFLVTIILIGCRRKILYKRVKPSRPCLVHILDEPAKPAKPAKPCRPSLVHNFLEMGVSASTGGHNFLEMGVSASTGGHDFYKTEASAITGGHILYKPAKPAKPAKPCTPSPVPTFVDREESESSSGSDVSDVIKCIYSEDVKHFSSDSVTELIICFKVKTPFERVPLHPFYSEIIDNLSSMLKRSCTNLKTIVFSRLTIGYKQISEMVLLKKEIEDISKYMKKKKDVAQLCSGIIGRLLKGNHVKFDIRDFLFESSLKDSSFADSIILNLICYDLAKSHRGIQEVYPASIKEDSLPTIVCFLDEEINISRFRGFRLKTLMAYMLTEESTKLEDSIVKDSENYKNVVSENVTDINATIAFHSQTLLSKHSNIEAIGVSFLKYNEENEVEICPCIVIYCKLKSAIPYKESHFPRKLDHPHKFKSFPTDIRVGQFSFCPGGFASGRKGKYQEITMGCSIGESGTAYSASVGPFVNLVETNETCFLTVRHLFSLSRSDEEIIGKGIVQPADCDKVLGLSPEPDSTCGKVIALVLSEKVDAALVKISEERKPSRGLFADITIGELENAGLSQTHVTTFDDGAQMDVDGLTLQSAYACRPILKVGAETGLTKGFLATTSGVVKITDYKEKLETTYNGRRESHYMTKLLFVESRAGNKFFCQPGDSGAAAFLLDSSIKLHCIGIVIGVLHNTFTVVTPIGAVLDAFKQKYPNVTLELKKFNLDAMDTQ